MNKKTQKELEEWDNAMNRTKGGKKRVRETFKEKNAVDYIVNKIKEGISFNKAFIDQKYISHGGPNCKKLRNNLRVQQAIVERREKEAVDEEYVLGKLKTLIAETKYDRDKIKALELMAKIKKIIDDKASNKKPQKISVSFPGAENGNVVIENKEDEED